VTRITATRALASYSGGRAGRIRTNICHRCTCPSTSIENIEENGNDSKEKDKDHKEAEDMFERVFQQEMDKG